MAGTDFRKWQCTTCGEIYDEALGDPESGIAAGTRFEDIWLDRVTVLCICASAGAGSAGGLCAGELRVHAAPFRRPAQARRDRSAWIGRGLDLSLVPRQCRFI